MFLCVSMDGWLYSYARSLVFVPISVPMPIPTQLTDMGSENGSLLYITCIMWFNCWGCICAPIFSVRHFPPDVFRFFFLKAFITRPENRLLAFLFISFPLLFAVYYYHFFTRIVFYRFYCMSHKIDILRMMERSTSEAFSMRPGQNNRNDMETLDKKRQTEQKDLCQYPTTRNGVCQQHQHREKRSSNTNCIQTIKKVNRNLHREKRAWRWNANVSKAYRKRIRRNTELQYFV